MTHTLAVKEVQRPDGVKIRYGIWRGQQKPTQAVLFLNGRTEWIEKYDFIPGLLNLKDSTAFVSIDHRGQGASGGRRAHIDSYDDFAADTQAVVAESIGKDVPYALLTHSMGGLIGLYAMATGRIAPSTGILCSPLLGLPEDPIPAIVARPLSRLLSFTPLTYLSSGAGQMDKSPFTSNRLTHSNEMFDKITHSPYPLRGVTFGWVKATFAAMQKVHSPEALKSISVPLLILTGSDERVVNAAAFSPWIQQANQCAKARIDFISIHGGRHELLSETPEFRDQAIAHIKQRLSAFTQ